MSVPVDVAKMFVTGNDATDSPGGTGLGAANCATSSPEAAAEATPPKIASGVAGEKTAAIDAKITPAQPGRDERLIQLIMLMKAIDDEEDRFALAKTEHKDTMQKLQSALRILRYQIVSGAERITIGAGGVTRSTVSAEAWCATKGVG